MTPSKDKATAPLSACCKAPVYFEYPDDCGKCTKCNKMTPQLYSDPQTPTGTEGKFSPANPAALSPSVPVQSPMPGQLAKQLEGEIPSPGSKMSDTMPRGKEEETLAAVREIAELIKNAENQKAWNTWHLWAGEIASLCLEQAEEIKRLRGALVDANNVFCECRYKEECNCYHEMQTITEAALSP